MNRQHAHYEARDEPKAQCFVQLGEGVRVPQDISVVGFDDIELARFTGPALTTVAQPKRNIGVIAVDMLLERIQGGRVDAKKVMLQPELIVRLSTAPARNA